MNEQEAKALVKSLSDEELYALILYMRIILERREGQTNDK